MEDLPTDAGQNYATVTYTVPTASDNVDEELDVICRNKPGSRFQVGEDEVLCSATDSSNNKFECAFKVTVKGKIRYSTRFFSECVDWKQTQCNFLEIGLNWPLAEVGHTSALAKLSPHVKHFHVLFEV